MTRFEVQFFCSALDQMSRAFESRMGTHCLPPPRFALPNFPGFLTLVTREGWVVSSRFGFEVKREREFVVTLCVVVGLDKLLWTVLDVTIEVCCLLSSLVRN